MREIKLSRGMVALVSDKDYSKVSKYKWYANPAHLGNGRHRPMEKWYARNHKVGYMHRFIVDAPKGMVVDHLDGNGLNNTRGNLKITTQEANTFHCKFRSWKKPPEEPFL